MISLRLIAAALLAATLSGVGMEAASARERRLESVERLTAALGLLRTEIGYGAVPLPQALARVGGIALPPVGPFLLAVAQRLSANSATEAAVVQAFVHECRTAPFADRERRVLLDLAEVLGRSDRSDQALNLTRAIDLLTHKATTERPQVERTASLLRSLGFLAGLAAAVLVL